MRTNRRYISGLAQTSRTDNPHHHRQAQHDLAVSGDDVFVRTQGTADPAWPVL